MIVTLDRGIPHQQDLRRRRVGFVLIADNDVDLIRPYAVELASIDGRKPRHRHHAHAVALHYMYYNFGRAHKSLRNPYPRTPAMAAGVADHIWTCEEIAALLD